MFGNCFSLGTTCMPVAYGPLYFKSTFQLCSIPYCKILFFLLLSDMCHWIFFLESNEFLRVLTNKVIDFYSALILTDQGQLCFQLKYFCKSPLDIYCFRHILRMYKKKFLISCIIKQLIDFIPVTC